MTISNKLKLLLVVPLVILLVATVLVQAQSVIGFLFYSDNVNSDSTTINAGENTQIVISADSILESSMNVKIELFNNANELVATLLNADTSSDELVQNVEVTPLLYGTHGLYTIKSTVTGASGVTATDYLYLTVLEVSSTTDTTAPTITITSPTNGNVYGFFPTTLSYTVNDANLFTCWYSDGTTTSTPTACSNGINSFPGLSSSLGSNTWTVYATDTSGNDASVSTTFTVTIVTDTTAPTMTIASPIEGTTYNIANLNFQVSTDETSTVTYNLDNAGDITMTGVAQNAFSDLITGLTDGAHTVVFTATDFASTPNTATDTINFNIDTSAVDTTAPVITVTSPDEGEEYEEDINIRVNVDEACQSVRFSLDGNAQISLFESSTNYYTDELTITDEGEHYITIYATDLAGNTATQVINFEVVEKEDDKKSSSSSGSNYQPEVFTKYNKAKKTTINLADTNRISSLTWLQSLINWLVGLFGGSSVY
jgi:Bacterial Ig domain